MGFWQSVAMAMWCASLPAVVLCLFALAGDVARRLRKQTGLPA
jgi:hypothetical protein